MSAATVASVASSNRQWCAGTVQRETEGDIDGLIVGLSEGDALGLADGLADGLAVGDPDGDEDGAAVGGAQRFSLPVLWHTALRQSELALHC